MFGQSSVKNTHLDWHACTLSQGKYYFLTAAMRLEQPAETQAAYHKTQRLRVREPAVPVPCAGLPRSFLLQTLLLLPSKKTSSAMGGRRHVTSRHPPGSRSPWRVGSPATTWLGATGAAPGGAPVLGATIPDKPSHPFKDQLLLTDKGF